MTTPQRPEQIPPASDSPEAQAASSEARPTVDASPWSAPEPEVRAPATQPPSNADAQEVTAGETSPGQWATAAQPPTNAGAEATAGETWPATAGSPEARDPAGTRAEPVAAGGVRRLLAVGAVGAVAGALVVGILWAASSFVGGGGAVADQDAAAACQVFERVPDDWKAETVTEANAYRLGAGIALAQAAGKADREYVTLATQAQQVQQAVVTAQFQRVAQLVVDVRNTCDGV
jgi:hypothetical protein